MKFLSLDGLTQVIEYIKILINSSLTSAKKYTDDKISTVNSSIGNKANTSDLNSHANDTTKHITSTERTNWNSSYTHSTSTHAPSNAEANQNAFSNVKVGSTTVAADSKTDTLELVGSNMTITPDATNDKITFTVADGTTSAKGIVQLTDSTSSTSTTTAATPNSVKSAYDLANTAKTNAATAQATADSKVGSVSLASGTNNGTLKLTVNGTATDNIVVKGLGSAAYTASTAYAASNHNHTVSNITDLTATATELNYCDGVTSNIQTQLNGKASSSHGTHVEYSTTNPVMNGTSSVGTASTVSRSDHVHPTDTSRAAASHTHDVYFDTTTPRTANTVLAAPNGSEGGASFRKLVAADLPSHTHNYAGSSSAGGAATSALVADKAKSANSAVFTIPSNGTSNAEGGELEIYNQDGTYWALDTLSNNFRIFDSTGQIHLTLKKGDPTNSTFSGSADKVDGFHASASVGYYLRPISYGTSALTAGSSSLTSGYVYLQYE